MTMARAMGESRSLRQVRAGAGQRGRDDRDIMTVSVVASSSPAMVGEGEVTGGRFEVRACLPVVTRAIAYPLSFRLCFVLVNSKTVFSSSPRL